MGGGGHLFSLKTLLYFAFEGSSEISKLKFQEEEAVYSTFGFAVQRRKVKEESGFSSNQQCCVSPRDVSVQSYHCFSVDRNEVIFLLAIFSTSHGATIVLRF